MAISRVKLPEFSFTGKEIGSVSVKPSYPEININFKVQSGIDIFLEKMKLEQKGVNTRSYSFEEPGFMFGGTFRTAIASIFVGDKAYRNYIAKKFFNKEYAYVIDGYENYHEKLKGGDLEKEIKFFYALSLMEMGNIKSSIPLLKELSSGTDNMTYYSQDKLFEYLTKIGDSDGKLDICNRINRFTEYGLYNCLDTYYKKDMFDNVIKLSDQNREILNKNKQLDTYKIASLYMKGDLKSLLGYDPDFYKDVAGYIADAYLEKGEWDKAESIISKITNKEIKLFYSVKLAILKNDKPFLIVNANKIENDNNKLFLMLFYVNRNFPNVDMEIINNIKFENPVFYDYSNFYTGMVLLSEKRYIEAAESLNKISFYEELIENSIFYLAICYYYSDYGLSEIFFKKYLEKGKDKEKILLSKYMLGQFLFGDKKYDEALESIKGCNTNYCNELEAEIYFNKGDYKKASVKASHLFTDRGYLIAASSLFNLQNYEGALVYLKRIEKNSRDSDLLAMLTYFKLSKIDQGLDIYKKYNYDKDFTDNAARYLYLSGNYSDVINILRSKEKINSEQELMLANSYFSIGKYDEAIKRYFLLIDKKLYIYESSMAIFSIAQNQKDTGYVDKLITKISTMKFENKDILSLNLIRYLKENGNNKIALEKLNQFMKNFPTSNYLKDAYLLRGYLHESLGLYDECIKDSDRVLEYSSKDEEAKFVKAMCLKNINKKSALEIYQELADKSKRFEDVAKREIVMLTEDPLTIKESLNYFKTRDNIFYYDSMVRMLGLLEMRKEFPEFEAYIDELVATRSEKYVPVGYYYKSVLMFVKGDFKNSLNFAMRCYYLFPKSPFTIKAMQLALQIYKKNGDVESASKIENILEKLNKGGN